MKYSEVEHILDQKAQELKEQIDSNIIFNILTEDWHKVELEITFGKDRYHLHPEMEQWCRDNIGPGGWSYASPKTWEGMDDKVWLMHSMFGNTTFAFKHPKHYTLFVLRWSS